MHSVHPIWPVQYEKHLGLNAFFKGQSRGGASSAGGWEVAAGRRGLTLRVATPASAAT